MANTISRPHDSQMFEPFVKDIENVGLERIEIEKCFIKLIKKGLDNMSNKEIKQTIISELLLSQRPELEGRANLLKKKFFKQSLNKKLAPNYGCFYFIIKG